MIPVVRTLQEHWPGTQITWIIGKTEASLINDLSDGNRSNVEFIIFDKTGGWRAHQALRRQLKNRRFDIFLHMQASLRANLASLAVKAPIRLGFDKARARDYQWLFTNKHIEGESRVHVLDGFFQFLEALGIKERRLRWDIPVPQTAHDFVKQELPTDKNILAINPCTSVRKRNWRNWSVEGYAQLADYAAQHHGMQVVLTGGLSSQEQDFGEAIISACGTTPVNLIGKTSLKQLLAVLQHAAAVVAPDTGPAHMATAAGTPVIGLYATSNPLRTGPYLSQQWVVNKYPEMLEQEYGKNIEQLSWGKRVRNAQAMDSIRIDDVIKQLDKCLRETAVKESSD